VVPLQVVPLQVVRRPSFHSECKILPQAQAVIGNGRISLFVSFES